MPRRDDDDDGMDAPVNHSDVFHAVRNLAKSKEPRDVILSAVLLASTEFIIEQGGEQTPVAYFGVLLNGLRKYGEQTIETTGAIVHLLRLAMQAVATPVLRVSAEEGISLFRDVLSFCAADGTVARHAIPCVAFFLRAADGPTWAKPTVTHMFHTVVAETLDKRPRVRRAAVESVAQVLSKLEGKALKVASNIVRDIFTHALKASQQDMRTALHGLNLIKTVVRYLPESALNTIISESLPLLSTKTELVISSLMSALDATFEGDKPTVSSAAIMSVLNALASDTPPSSQNAAVSAVALYLSHAIPHLETVDPHSCARVLPSCVSLLLQYMSGEHTVAKPVNDCAKALGEILECVNLSQAEQSCVEIVQCMTGALNLPHQNCWGLVLKACEKLFEGLAGDEESVQNEALRNKAGQLIAPLLEGIANLMGATNPKSIEECVGAAIQFIGPIPVFTALPLYLFPGDHPTPVTPRVWLLPLFREYTRHGNLGLFIDHLLPASMRLFNMATTTEKAGHAAEAAGLWALFQMCWGFFAGMCNTPTDVQSRFTNLVPTLIQGLSDVRARSEICLGLGILAPSLKKKGFEEASAHVGSFAKPLLPPLFTAFCDAEPAERPIIAGAIKGVAGAGEVAVIGRLFDTTLRKLLQASMDEPDTMSDTKGPDRRALADLALAVVDLLPIKCANLLYRAVKPQLTDPDAKLQKQAYKAIRKLLGLPEFAKSDTDLVDIITALGQSMTECATPAKHSRLKAIAALVERSSGQRLQQVLMNLIGDPVLATKEVAQKARDFSFTLLIDMAKRAEKAGEGAVDVPTVMGYVNAGFAGATPHMMAAGALALSRLLYEFVTTLTDEAVAGTIRTVVLLLQHRAREVLKTAIGFVKVLVVCLPHRLLVQHMPEVLGALFALPMHHHRHFRLPIRVIVERCLRKLGEDFVAPCIPEEHRRLITALRKEKRKKQKEHEEFKAKRDDRKAKEAAYRQALEGSEDEDSDDQDADRMLADMEATNDEDELDLMNPRTAARLGARKKKTTEFPTSADGRFVVDDGSGKADAKSKEIGAKRARAEAAGSDDEMEISGGESDTGSILEFNQPMTHKLKKQQQKADNYNTDSDEDGDRKGRGKRGDRDEKKGGKSKAEMMMTGADYKSKKAAGDMKRLGKVDPYAFVPLNPKALNKRRRAGAHKQFEGLVKAAKKGAQRGSKDHKKVKAK